MRRQLFRSILFTPADRPKALQKSRSLACDVLIVDLEDAVSPEKKVESRTILKEFLKSQANQKTFIRVNGLETDWGRSDLIELAGCPIDGIVIPKVSNSKVVANCDRILKDAGNIGTPIWCMIETPLGVHNVVDIALCDRVQGLVFGSNDLSKELKAKQTVSREPLLYSMSQCILGARVAGKIVIDGVHSNFQDMVGFEQSCVQGRNLGFDGKSLIHPSQIDLCNQHYSPSQQELDDARAIAQLWKNEAEMNGKSVITFKGRMIEKLHVDEAQQLLDLFDDGN